MKKLIKNFLITFLLVFVGSVMYSQEEPSPFITGGNEIEIEDRPFQISIQRNGRHHCGGNIINKSWIITAAHCINGFNINDLQIAVGITEQNQVGFSGQLLEIENVFIHPNYNARTFDNDIALIELSTEINFNNSAKPIRLINNENQNLNDSGQNAIASGWGWTVPGVRLGANHLMGVRIPIISNEEADNQLDISSPRHAELTDNMIATGFLGSERLGPCHGDSGGPLTVENDEGVIHLVGLVSWGVGGCIGGSNSPTMYTNVLNYQDWIYGFLCEEDLIIDSNVDNGEFDIQKASKTITATNIIFTGASAKYNAGEKVRLKPGFKAANGSSFRAYIDGCGSSTSNLAAKQLTENTEIVSTALVDESISVTIYPNPTSRFVTISSGKLISSWELMDINGKLVMSDKSNNEVSQTKIDLEGLGSDLYILKITFSDNSFSITKLIKN